MSFLSHLVKDVVDEVKDVVKNPLHLGLDLATGGLASLSHLAVKEGLKVATSELVHKKDLPVLDLIDDVGKFI